MTYLSTLHGARQCALAQAALNGICLIESPQIISFDETAVELLPDKVVGSMKFGTRVYLDTARLCPWGFVRDAGTRLGLPVIGDAGTDVCQYYVLCFAHVPFVSMNRRCKVIGLYAALGWFDSEGTNIIADVREQRGNRLMLYPAEALSTEPLVAMA